MSLIAGIDVGGTFTDVAVYDTETGSARTSKVFSTHNQADGLLRGLHQVVEMVGQLAAVVHGTTVATNAIIERKGAKAALVTTAGFRDVLELRRRDRPDAYGLTGGYRPLIPRSRCVELGERLDANGDVVAELGVDGVRSVVNQLEGLDVESVGVCLLHSYADPVHENRIAEALRGALPGVHLSVSSTLAAEAGEFERASTTAINAFVHPRMVEYLREVRRRLTEEDFARDVWVMQSSGGLMQIDRAAEQPVRTVLSGPAAGTVGAAELAALAGIEDVISCDMGGTSFDVALIPGGMPAQSTGRQIAYGVPVQLPMVDIHTIGAGGGSIAWMDRGGVLQVGPESAGAEPGPAAYGRGGERPTVTDANAVLGRLDPQARLGTEEGFHIDVAAAESAIRKQISDPLGLSVTDAALGIIRVANVKMAGAIRRVSVDRGHDPRRFALVGFGGAGPAHIVELAAEIGSTRVLIPPQPGITSALGCLLADVRHDFVHAVNTDVDAVTAEQVRNVFAAQREQGVRILLRDQFPDERIEVHHFADMAYARQLHNLLVPLSDASGEWTGKHLTEAFLERYGETYGGLLRRGSVKLVNLRTVVVGKRETVRFSSEPAVEHHEPRHRPVTFVEGAYETPVVSRSALRPGERWEGPVIVEQQDTTTIVPPSAVVEVHPTGSLLVEVQS
ncbi:MAG TPA: hydantoinase/oxoprolinase family protein [Rubrobacteraceae bacterium]|nr:hydantoinase/oxoprolinase family protein [Rubrobacteraceae bacterium]